MAEIYWYAAGMASLPWAAWRAGAGGTRRHMHWLAPVICVGVAFAVTPWGLALDKLLGRLIMPTGLYWLLLLAIALAALYRRRGRLGLAALGLWLAYSALGNAWIGNALMDLLERDYRQPHDLSQPFDAIMLLGGATNHRPTGVPQLAPAGDRLATAARLYHRGATTRLVCSGTGIAAMEGPGAPRDLGREAVQILAGLAVPQSAIETLPGPRNTKEEIAALAKLSRDRGWTRVGVVTSAWHLRRVMRHAARNDFTPIPLPADYRGGFAPPGMVGFVPSGGAVYAIRLAVWELVGAAVGR